MLLIAAACGDSGSEPPTTSLAPATSEPPTTTTVLVTTSTTPPPTTTTAPQAMPILASGVFAISAAESFDEEGFHQAVSIAATAPASLGEAELLVVRLFDADRAEQTCDSEHPLSGCVTVDWSDSEARPNVPAGGVFDNRLTVETASGPRTFYLSESGALADEPDPFDPG